jgi:hypothetical protein
MTPGHRQAVGEAARRRRPASWPVIASATSTTWRGETGRDDALDLAHELLVDRLASRGVDEDRVGAPRAAASTPVARDGDRIGARLRRVHRHVEPAFASVVS